MYEYLGEFDLQSSELLDESESDDESSLLESSLESPLDSSEEELSYFLCLPPPIRLDLADAALAAAPLPARGEAALTLLLCGRGDALLLARRGEDRFGDAAAALGEDRFGDAAAALGDAAPRLAAAALGDAAPRLAAAALGDAAPRLAAAARGEPNVLERFLGGMEDGFYYVARFYLTVGGATIMSARG